MSLMESGIKLGGGPVAGSNWKTRIHEIAADLTHKFGGKPAESTVHVVCLCLFQVQHHLRAIIREDPGSNAFAGNSRLRKAACHENFFLRLIEFCRHGNKEIQKRVAAARARRPNSYVYPTGSGGILNNPPKKSPLTKPPATKPPLTKAPLAGSGANFLRTKDISSKRPKFSNMATRAVPETASTTRAVPETASTTAAGSAVKQIGPEAARLLIKLSESIVEKNKMEVIMMKHKEKEYQFEISMKKIGVLENKMSTMDKSDPLYSSYQDKIRELIKEL